MSEVKPTLVKPIESDTEIPTNSWLSNFPSGKWIDARDRYWFWIMTNVNSVQGAYEYRFKFDTFTDNFTIIFPFVVKTSDNGVNKVFINGVVYKVRSEENYGDRFVVSGLEFSFKVATKNKLGKNIYPVITYNFNHGNFVNVNNVLSDYIRLRYYSKTFYIVHFATTDYIRIRVVSADFTTKLSISCDTIAMKTISSIFNNINILFAPVIANCKDTSWARFGGIWQSCDTWMPLT